jgi:hypothetical protein
VVLFCMSYLLRYVCFVIVPCCDNLPCTAEKYFTLGDFPVRVAGMKVYHTADETCILETPVVWGSNAAVSREQQPTFPAQLWLKPAARVCMQVVWPCLRLQHLHVLPSWSHAAAHCTSVRHRHVSQNLLSTHVAPQPLQCFLNPQFAKYLLCSPWVVTMYCCVESNNVYCCVCCCPYCCAATCNVPSATAV